MKPKRADIVPGAVLSVRPGHELQLDPHLLLSGRTRIMASGGVIHVIDKPRRDKDGINLVKVKVGASGEYECFYCDVLNHCEV